MKAVFSFVALRLFFFHFLERFFKGGNPVGKWFSSYYSWEEAVGRRSTTLDCAIVQICSAQSFEHLISVEWIAELIKYLFSHNSKLVSHRMSDIQFLSHLWQF